MSVKENKSIARRWYKEVLEKRKIALIDKFIASDTVDHAAPPGQAPGIEGVKQAISMWLRPFPDAKIRVEFMVAERDMIVTRLTFNGTHKGELMGIPATGKRITMTGMDALRIKKGKIVEHWDNFDILSLMQQLGAIPPPGQQK